MHHHYFAINCIRGVKTGAQLLAFQHSQGTFHNRSVLVHISRQNYHYVMSPDKKRTRKNPKPTKQYCATFEAPSMYHRKMNSSVAVPLFEGIMASCNKAQSLWLQGNAECSHRIEPSDLDVSHLGFSSLTVQRRVSFYL